MCGHVGYAGDSNLKTMKVFRDLLLMDQMRGEHATGVALVPWLNAQRTADETIIHKMPINATDFLKQKYTKDLLTRVNFGVVMGHNRHATAGVHSVNNSHPFLFDNLVGAHNGTVSSSNRKDVAWMKENDDYGTDSETIFAAIDADGVEAVVPEMVAASSHGGAWALVWFDFNTNSINFLRNDYRPLYYAFTEDAENLFWASEAYMLHTAAVRHGLKLDKVMALPKDVMHSWTVPSQGEIFAVEEGLTKVALAGKKPETYKSGTSGGYRGRSAWGSREKTKNLTSTTSLAATTIKYTATSFDEFLKPYNLDSETLITMFNGYKDPDLECFNCAAQIDKADITAKKCGVINNKNIICPACKTDMHKNPSLKLIKGLKKASA